MKKYKGIDSRDIKCCCTNPQCVESGLSFEEDMLVFYFLEIIPGSTILHQKRRTMYLNKQTRKEIIKSLRSLNLKS